MKKNNQILISKFNNENILILKLSPLSVLIQLDMASSITRALLILIFSALFWNTPRLSSLLITRELIPHATITQNSELTPLALPMISWTLFPTETDTVVTMWWLWSGHTRWRVTSQCGRHSPHTTHYSLSTCRGQTSKITHQAVVIILQTENPFLISEADTALHCLVWLFGKLWVEPGIRMSAFDITY